MKKLFLLLMLSVTIAVNAQTSRGVAALDTIITTTPVPADSFSRAAGIMLAPSLQTYAIQNLGVDPDYMDDFISGLRATPDEAYTKRMNAYAAGLTIAMQNYNSIIPSLNNSAVGSADSSYVIPYIFIDALVSGLKSNDAAAADEAMAVVQRQEVYRNQVLHYANAEYLVNNAKQQGIVTLPSGLQYRIIEAGQGVVATDSSTVQVHYEGRLIDGTVFDSSYQRNQPAEFKPSQVIKGWTEALTMMPEGSTWELYIPYDLAYGAQGTRSIPPYSTLIFKVQVLQVK